MVCVAPNDENDDRWHFVVLQHHSSTGTWVVDMMIDTGVDDDLNPMLTIPRDHDDDVLPVEVEVRSTHHHGDRCLARHHNDHLCMISTMIVMVSPHMMMMRGHHHTTLFAGQH
jgi:hypothetical protein